MLESSQRNKLFQSRCTINGRVFNLIIDSGSCENVIAEAVVSKLHLTVPFPYKLAWIQQGNEVSVSTRALVEFSIGTSYKDQLFCDIVPMDACHLLLGRSWEFDRRVTHDGFLNTYTFHFNNRTFTLKPYIPTLPAPPINPIMLLQRVSFEAEMREAGMVFFVLHHKTVLFRLVWHHC